ncbi:DDE-type integrase/transposase/recombinase [Mesorhizobium sp. M0166]
MIRSIAHRFPAEIISHAVWLYFRFPLSLRMVEDMLAARGIIVTHQTIRNRAEKFGRHFANDVRRRSAGRLGDKGHLDEVVVSVEGKKCWLWRAVDQEGFVIDVLVQPQEYKGRQTSNAQTAYGTRATSARHNHRQASIIRRCETTDHAGCGASEP